MSKIRDLVIVGAGPAALCAALYAARERLITVVYEKESFGGKIAGISHIDNYPGAGLQITGQKLAEDLKAQAEHFGALMEYGEVEKIEKDESGLFRLIIDGEEVLARTVLVAAGSANRKLGVVREEYGGVHYCATCDGAFYAGKNVIVVGGGNSAVQEAFFLLKFAKHVTIISATEITATRVLQQKMQEYVKDGKIDVMVNENVKEITGENQKADGVLLENGKKISGDGIFVFIGQSPSVAFLGETKVKFDECGYVITDQNMETDEPGIFAAGDVRSGSTKQIVSAAGEGATAAMAIGKYLS